jgi:hypothetical protein
MTNLQKLQATAKEVNGELRFDYSGHGMFGRTCYGIVCEDIFQCVEIAASNGLRGAKYDDMGRQFIVYWPHISDDKVA